YLLEVRNPATHSFEHTAGTFRTGVVHPGKIPGCLHQSRLGLANDHSRESRFEQAEIVEGVACDKHPVRIRSKMVYQRAQGAPLAHATWQHVEVLATRMQYLDRQVLQPASYLGNHLLALGEERNPSLLRHRLPHQAFDAGEGVQHRNHTSPLGIDLPLQRCDGPQAVALDDGRADIGDHPLWIRNQWVVQQRDHRFDRATGHEHQSNVAARPDGPIESQAVGLAAAEKCSVEISCQQQDCITPFGYLSNRNLATVEWIATETAIPPPLSSR